MTLERKIRDAQKDYNNKLICKIMNCENPERMIRYFRYRKLQERDCYITKRSLLREFGVKDTTVKKYLQELDKINGDKKPGVYKLPHKAKLEMSAIEML
jgi:hypothetical protein